MIYIKAPACSGWLDISIDFLLGQLSKLCIFFETDYIQFRGNPTGIFTGHGPSGSGVCPTLSCFFPGWYCIIVPTWPQGLANSEIWSITMYHVVHPLLVTTKGKLGVVQGVGVAKPIFPIIPHPTKSVREEFHPVVYLSDCLSICQSVNL